MVSAAGGSGSSGGASSVRPAERAERRDTTPPSPQSQSEFEAALQSRQSKHESDGGEGQDDERRETPADGVTGLAAAFAPPLPLQGQHEEAPVAAPRTSDVPPSGTQVKMEAALNANVATAITDVGASDPAALWEASVNAPNAVPLEVRVLRGERIGSETNAQLTVSVRSSSVSADVLGRHASKLDERLKKRGVDGMHVRIEDGEEPA